MNGKSKPYDPTFGGTLRTLPKSTRLRMQCDDCGEGCANEGYWIEDKQRSKIICLNCYEKEYKNSSEWKIRMFWGF